MMLTLSKPEPRCVERDGKLYVGVTSAMKLVKQLLNEPEDFYGPPALARVHQLEGTGCHAACLDALAHCFHWIPSYDPPAWPEAHGDERRWHNVIHTAVAGFLEFCDQYEVEPIGIEQEVFSSTYGLVGHVDLPCLMKWKRSRIKTVCDLKFVAALMESHRLQVRCYGKMDAFRDYQLGLLYHGNRTTGKWAIEPVDLRANLQDVIMVSHAAKLWQWQQSKQEAL